MKRFPPLHQSGSFLHAGVIGALLALAMPLSEAHAVTYLKADAPEGGDGASWTTAYRDVGEAVESAQTKDGIVYAAGGLYFVTNKVVLSGEVSLYGGFPGISVDETPADRDDEVHQTILTGDVDLDDHWIHVEPLPGEYRFSYTDLTNAPVIAGGRFNPPPAYTGDHDAYVAAFKGPGPVKGNILIDADATALLDGLWFVAFRNGGPWLNVAQKAKGARIHRCRFLAANVNETICDDAGVGRITSCEFRHLKGKNSGLKTRGATQVADCRFESLVREGSSTAAVVFFCSGKGADVRRCVFTRSLDRSTHEGHESDKYYPPANVVSSYSGIGTFADCVVSNCFSTSPFRYGSPMLGMRNGAVLRCAFLNNRYEVKPVEGRVYSMFGIAGEAVDFHETFEGCTFRGNVASAPQVAATSGDYVISIAGTGCNGCRYGFVNCTFDSNRVEATPVEGVEAILSRGIASAVPDPSVVSEVGVANCTFAGPASGGLYDIVQYGPDHSVPTVIVNSLFMADDVDVASPFYVSAPAQFLLVDSTVKNLVAADGTFEIKGLRYDELPFEADPVASVSHVPVLVPAARTPGLREASDVSTNSSSIFPVTYRYRPFGEEQWLPLLPGVEKTVSGRGVLPIPDANGHGRTFGAFTRGAVQALSDEAEGGATLVLRKSPLDGGSLIGPATQAVPAGGVPETVTAVAAEGNTFDGWYDIDGSLVSTAPELSLGTLETDRILVARFVTPGVTVTFDLGKSGTFRENGRSSITLHLHSGDLFPELPPCDLSPDWIVDGWSPALPPYVGDEPAAYSARYVTTGVNVVHVVPPGEEPAGGDGSGASWADATSDLAAAYAEAARYRGEVWMKEGLYPVASSLVGRSNVSVIGGFAGTESSSAEADPLSHPTILTGDLGGDDCWAPNGVLPDPADRVAVWEGSRFFDPNPDGVDLYWNARDPGEDDTWTFLTDQEGAFTNAALAGLTLTGFSRTVIEIKFVSGLDIRSCRFLANGSAWHTKNATPMISCTEGSLRMEGCELAGNYFPVSVVTHSKEDAPALFRDCVFRDNFSRNITAGLRADGYQAVVLDGCSFIRNCGLSKQGWNATAFHCASRDADVVVTNCLFRGNRSLDGSCGAISHRWYNSAMRITGCVFLDNTLSNPVPDTSAACIARDGDYGILVIRDSYFEGNRVETEKATAGKRWASVVSATRSSSQSYYGTILLNCTLAGNSVRNGSAGPAIGTISTSFPVALVNSLVDGSRFEGESAEIVMEGGTAATTLSLVNTVARNPSAAYRPFALLADGLGVSIANSAISGLEGGLLPCATGDFRYEVSSVPGGISSVRRGPGGRMARAISAASPYGRAGRPVWQVSGDKCYIHDPVGKPDRPWRDLLDKSSSLRSIAGLSLESPPIPDAFGVPRVAGRIAYGPLNALSSGTLMMVR